MSSCLNLIILHYFTTETTCNKCCKIFLHAHIYNNVYMIKYKLCAIFYSKVIFDIHVLHVVTDNKCLCKYFVKIPQNILEKNLNYLLLLIDRLLFRCLILLPVFLSGGHASCPWLLIGGLLLLLICVTLCPNTLNNFVWGFWNVDDIEISLICQRSSHETLSTKSHHLNIWNHRGLNLLMFEVTECTSVILHTIEWPQRHNYSIYILVIFTTNYFHH